MDREKLDNLHDLTGRVAIITGGTRGIGKAIQRRRQSTMRRGDAIAAVMVDTIDGLVPSPVQSIQHVRAIHWVSGHGASNTTVL